MDNNNVNKKEASLTWIEVGQDVTVGKIIKVQNRSLVPESTVHIYVGNTPPTSTDTPRHTLVSMQVFTLSIPVNVRVFYATEKGGIFTFTQNELHDLINYDIPTIHKKVMLPANATHVVNVPEGATITMQNHSDDVIGVSLGGVDDGVFILSSLQLLSESVVSDSTVTFKGNVLNPTEFSYSIVQSAVITQLSNEFMLRVSTMEANINMLINDMASDQDLIIVQKMLEYNKFSSALTVSSTSADKILLPMMKVDYGTDVNSKFKLNTSTNSIIELSIDVPVIINGFEVNTRETAIIEVSTMFMADNTKRKFTISSCSNVAISSILKNGYMVISKDRTSAQLCIEFNTTITNISVSVVSRAETAKVKLFNAILDKNEIGSVNYELEFINIINPGVLVDDTAIISAISVLDSTLLNAKREVFTSIVISATGSDIFEAPAVSDFMCSTLPEGSTVDPFSPATASHPQRFALKVTRDINKQYRCQIVFPSSYDDKIAAGVTSLVGFRLTHNYPQDIETIFNMTPQLQNLYGGYLPVLTLDVKSPNIVSVPSGVDRGFNITIPSNEYNDAYMSNFFIHSSEFIKRHNEIIKTLGYDVGIDRPITIEIIMDTDKGGEVIYE